MRPNSNNLPKQVAYYTGQYMVLAFTVARHRGTQPHVTEGIIDKAIFNVLFFCSWFAYSSRKGRQLLSTFLG